MGIHGNSGRAGLLKNPVLGTDLAFGLGTALWE
jgi:hypothetical protein